MRNARQQAFRSVIISLVLLVLVKGVLFAALTPAWGQDDEVAYWADIKSIVGEKPVFRGATPTHHGRLYQQSISPLYIATKGLSIGLRLLIIRLVSVIFLGAVVVLTFLTARKIWPNSGFIQISAPLFVAFNPKVSFIMASVSPDTLLMLIFSVFLYALVSVVIKPTAANSLVLFVALVAGTLTKARFLIALPLAGAPFLIFVFWTLKKLPRLETWLKERVLFVLAGGAALAWWLLRWVSAADFGFSGKIGLASLTLDRTVLAKLNEPMFSERLFSQFWGFFGGGSGIYFSIGIYRLLLAVCLAALLGLAVRGYKQVRRVLSTPAPAAGTGPEPASSGLEIQAVTSEELRHLAAVGLVGLSALLLIQATGAYEVYGASALGRYLLTGSASFSLLLAAGLDGLVPEKARHPFLVALAIALFSLNILSLSAYLMPRLY